MAPLAVMPVRPQGQRTASAIVEHKTTTSTKVTSGNRRIFGLFALLFNTYSIAFAIQVSTHHTLPPTVPGFDPTKYVWVQTGPGQWSVREKETTKAGETDAPEAPVVDFGPSIRELVGGDLDLTMSGEVHFGLGDVSPSEHPADYARKLQMLRKRAGFRL